MSRSLHANNTISLTDKIEAVIGILGYLLPLILCLAFIVGLAFLMEARIGGI
ncbi:hypothetical protein [Methanobacterium spitsbergense]|uniref:Uncharacterized protein n=1 Tax=Methanobacterium spitsbergense TaxID=2874285 RepID=A0A8T5URH5_9EURY|nr:hypothetical protein [Methanobacterium spitsbergense]MBZ2166368.1 hypothetical protein [Methanobacterium spitsbergense]